MTQMSTVKELYDEAFISCLKSGLIDDTEDNYSNPTVLQSVTEKEKEKVQQVYAIELKNDLNKICILQNLMVLLGPNSTIRYQVARMIWSYSLYLKMLNAAGTSTISVSTDLDNLYTNIMEGAEEATVFNSLNTLLDMSDKTDSSQASPDLYAFLNQLASLRPGR